MKLPKPKSKRSAFIITVVSVIALAGLGFAWFQTTQRNQNLSPAEQAPDVRKVNDVDYSPPTDEDKKQQDQQKDDIINQATDDGNTNTSITVSISRASQPAVGQPLDVRTVVTGATGGTCELTLTKDGQTTVAKTFSIAADATYSTCANAKIPASDFPASGSWKLQVVAKSGSTSSQPASLTVNITK